MVPDVTLVLLTYIVCSPPSIAFCGKPLFASENWLCTQMGEDFELIPSSRSARFASSMTERTDEADVVTFDQLYAKERVLQPIQNLRNLILAGLFIPRPILLFPPSLAVKRNWLCGVHRPSKMRFLRIRLDMGQHLLNSVQLRDVVASLPIYPTEEIFSGGLRVSGGGGAGLA